MSVDQKEEHENLSLEIICKCLEIKLQKKIKLVKENIYDLTKKMMFKGL